jgi:hypothetical protein
LSALPETSAVSAFSLVPGAGFCSVLPQAARRVHKTSTINGFDVAFFIISMFRNKYAELLVVFGKASYQ